MKTAYYFKILQRDKIGTHTHYRWPKVGVWTKRIEGKLIPCKKGYHVLRPRDLKIWLRARLDNRHALYLVEAEVSGRKTTSNKIVVRRARIVKRLPLYKVKRKLNKLWNTYCCSSTIKQRKIIIKEVMTTFGIKALW